MSAWQPRRRRDPSPRNVRVAAAASPRPTPRNIRVAAAASPRPVSAESPQHADAAKINRNGPRPSSVDARRPGLPLALKGASFTCEAGSKVGIVGRTGAGKSTILVGLFRLVDVAGGSINIDGVDTATLGLKLLRRRLCIIPQEATLLTGTARQNLDPFDEHSLKDCTGGRADISRLDIAASAEYPRRGPGVAAGDLRRNQSQVRASSRPWASRRAC